MLKAHEDETSNQIAIVVIDGLHGQDLEKLSFAIAEKGFGGKGLGTADKDNGVLVLVAIQDRKWRVEVGYGLEGPLPDVKADEIFQDLAVPEFKQNYTMRASAPPPEE
jgi:uncharacterized protein